jgi:hypothetical protein
MVIKEGPALPDQSAGPNFYGRNAGIELSAFGLGSGFGSGPSTRLTGCAEDVDKSPSNIAWKSLKM